MLFYVVHISFLNVIPYCLIALLVVCVAFSDDFCGLAVMEVRWFLVFADRRVIFFLKIV